MGTIKITELPAKVTPAGTDLVQTVDTANNKTTLTEVFAQAKILNSDLVDKTTAEILTNKDLSSGTNTFPTLNQDTTGKSANTDALNSATTIVNTSLAPAPIVGQTLVATSDSTATWQTVIVASATETIEGVVERATDAEATTGTDVIKFITPKQAKDNYSIKTVFGNLTKDTNDSTATTIIPHGLGKAPKKVSLTAFTYSGTNLLTYSQGTSDGTLNKCIQLYESSAISSLVCISFGRVNGTAGWVQGTITLDTTNITINWVSPTSFAGDIYTGLIQWEAEA